MYISMRIVILMILLRFFYIGYHRNTVFCICKHEESDTDDTVEFFFIGYHRNTVYCTCKHEDSDTDDTVEVFFLLDIIEIQSTVCT